MSNETISRPELTQAALEAVPPGRLKDDPILIAFGMLRTFGGIRAVDVDHLEIERGSITAIIGPNGAGKTTLFNLLTGFDKPNRGTWRLFPESHDEPLSHRNPLERIVHRLNPRLGSAAEANRLDGLPSHHISQLGMVRTFQLTKSLSRLTVLENMMVASPIQKGERLDRALLRWLWKPTEDQEQERALALLERFSLTHMIDEQAGTLSGGQRKLLEMARALMANPEVVMLDEPTAGVNPALTESLLDHIRNLNAEGVTIVFVEHDMDVVMGISDWVVVMAEGSILAEGRPEDIVANEEVIDAYLGRTHEGEDEDEEGNDA